MMMWLGRAQVRGSGAWTGSAPRAGGGAPCRAPGKFKNVEGQKRNAKAPNDGIKSERVYLTRHTGTVGTRDSVTSRSNITQ